MTENQIATPGTAAQKGLVKKYFTGLPVFFPLIGLFLLGLTLFEANLWIGDDSVSRVYWFRPLLSLLYTLFWMGACLLNKRMAMAFIILSILNVSFHFFGPDIIWKRALGEILFVPLPVNLLFSFMLLFYFRRMN